MLGLKVLTLNCWDMPWAVPGCTSLKRKQRLSAIGDWIVNGGYDFVFLQEVWAKEDFQYLQMVLKCIMPHSVYFQLGVLGTGTCIFSQHKIGGTFNFLFSINGFSQQIVYGGGFLSGSGLGSVSVSWQGLKLLLAVTHFHADDAFDGKFLLDRTCQALQSKDFINLMSNSGYDLILLAGDFNSHPGELPHRILTNCMEDSWAGKYSTTFGQPSNTYSGCSELEETLDYIFYKAVGGKAKITNCAICLPLPDKVPGENFSYSDHEAVQVEFTLDKESKNEEMDIEAKPSTNCFNDEINNLLTAGLTATEDWQMEYLVWMLPIPFFLFVVPILISLIMLGTMIWCASMILILQNRKMTLLNFKELQTPEQNTCSNEFIPEL